MKSKHTTLHVLRLVSYIGLFLVFLTSCSSKKFLTEDEYLLSGNVVVIEGEHLPKSEKSRLRELTESRIALKPNGNSIFFFPKERSSLKYRFAVDTPSLTSLIMRLDGEIPSLIDSARIESVTENLKNTLMSEGYYDADAEYEILYKKKSAKVMYHLKPKKVYTLDTFMRTSEDTAILKVIDQIETPTLMVKGTPVSADLRDKESKRIAAALRNKGYYDFNPGLFSRFFAYDTTQHSVDLDFIIYPPPNDTVFRVYTIGNIYVYPGYGSSVSDQEYRDTLIGDYHFRTVDGNLIMKPHLMAEKIAIKPGDYYTYRDFRTTILRLNTLDIFKTPRIIIEKVNDTSTVLNYHIQLGKQNKFEDEAGLENFVSSISGDDLYLGLSLHAGRRIRNLFGGSETFSINVDGSTEFSIQGNDNQNINTIGISMGLQTPRYRDWLSLKGVRLLPYGKHIFTDEFMSDLKTLGEQFVNISFNYEDFQTFYTSTSIKLSRGATLNRGNHKFSFVFQDLDILSPDTGSMFTDFVGDNEFFRLSFQKQLITGFIFRSLSYQYNSPVVKNKSYSIFVGFESSGHEISLVNWIAGGTIGEVNLLGESFTFSQFIKAEIEPKFTYYLNRKQSLAFRLGIGVAMPYDEADQVPYSELFSLGGSYSLRAWRNREVGPGFENNTVDSDGETVTTPFVADQLKLEISAEYRFDLAWIVEGALFAEAGNVWSLTDPDDFQSPESQLRQFSWKSIAMDAGFGLRFDLTFFLFRFDLAFPVRNWYEDDNGNHWNTGSWKALTNNPRIQIGINYPF